MRQNHPAHGNTRVIPGVNPLLSAPLFGAPNPVCPVNDVVEFELALLVGRAQSLAQAPQLDDSQIRHEFLYQRYQNYFQSKLNLGPVEAHADQVAELLEQQADNTEWLAEVDARLNKACDDFEKSQQKAPDWRMKLKYNAVFKFYENCWSSKLKPLPLPAEEGDLQLIILGFNAALNALKDGRHHTRNYKDLDNQLKVLEERLNQLRAFFATRHPGESIAARNSRRALFKSNKDYEELLENVKPISEYFNSFYNAATKMVLKKPEQVDLPDVDEAINPKWLVNTPDGTLDDYEVSDDTLQNAIDEFRKKHGDRSIEITKEITKTNKHFEIRFNPPATFVLHASYSQFRDFQASFIRILKRHAAEENSKVELQAHLDRVGAKGDNKKGASAPPRAPVEDEGSSPRQAGGEDVKGGAPGPNDPLFPARQLAPGQK